MAEERGLGQELDVEEGRGRAERDGSELLAAVDLAGRVDIEHRDREDQFARQAADPAEDPPRESQGPPARDVVGEVDRREQRCEMCGRPRLEGGRDQDERSYGLLEGIL